MITVAATWTQVAGCGIAGLALLLLMGCAALSMIRGWNDDDER